MYVCAVICIYVNVFEHIHTHTILQRQAAVLFLYVTESTRMALTHETEGTCNRFIVLQ